MASTANAIVSVGEYLHTVYRPDVDYVDGRLEDRNVGEYDHSSLQAALMRYLSAHRMEWNIRIVQEQRMQINTTRLPRSGYCSLLARRAARTNLQAATAGLH